MRLRQVTELAPAEAIASNAAWSQHFDRTKDEPRAAADDIVRADVVLLGSPTRYGNIASQLKQFLDTLRPAVVEGSARRQGLRWLHRVDDRARRPGVHPARAVQHHPPLRRDHRVPRLHRPAEVRRRQPLRCLARHRRLEQDPLTDVQYAALDHMATRAVGVARRLKACGAG